MTTSAVAKKSIVILDIAKGDQVSWKTDTIKKNLAVKELHLLNYNRFANFSPSQDFLLQLITCESTMSDSECAFLQKLF